MLFNIENKRTFYVAQVIRLRGKANEIPLNWRRPSCAPEKSRTSKSLPERRTRESDRPEREKVFDFDGDESEIDDSVV